MCFYLWLWPNLRKTGMSREFASRTMYVFTLIRSKIVKVQFLWYSCQRTFLLTTWCLCRCYVHKNCQISKKRHWTVCWSKILRTANEHYKLYIFTSHAYWYQCHVLVPLHILNLIISKGPRIINSLHSVRPWLLAKLSPRHVTWHRNNFRLQFKVP